MAVPSPGPGGWAALGWPGLLMGGENGTGQRVGIRPTLSIIRLYHVSQLSPRGPSGERTWLPTREMQQTRVQSLGQEDPLEKEMATCSSILVWVIPWTEEPGGLYSPCGHKESGTTEHTHTYQLDTPPLMTPRRSSI